MRAITLIITCLFITALVLLTGCDKFMNTVTDTVNSIQKESSSLFGTLEQSDSTTSVDGVKLKFIGMSVLKEAYNSPEFTLDEGAAVIKLTGIEEKTADLRISYKEYTPNDVAISFADNSIKAKTKSGKPFLITGIEGKIARNLNLNIKVGAGTITLTDMQDNTKVMLETGAGNISVQDCQMKSLTTKTGAGKISLHGCQIISLNANTSAGGITLTDSQIDKMDASVGAGNITLTNSKVTKRNFETSVGRVIEQ